MAPEGVAFFTGNDRYMGCFTIKGTHVLAVIEPRVINAREKSGGLIVPVREDPEYSGIALAIYGLDTTCDSFERGIVESAAQVARVNGAQSGNVVGGEVPAL